MAFVITFNLVIIFTLMRPRLAHRTKGPLVEWAAFKEVPYALFTIGTFLALWGIYFAYYYVRTTSPLQQRCRYSFQLHLHCPQNNIPGIRYLTDSNTDHSLRENYNRS